MSHRLQTAPERPLLYLDVDGVINCPSTELAHRRLTVRAGTHELPLVVPDGVAERLALLAERFEIRWATAWFEGALGIPSALGLESGEQWPVLRWDELKLAAILADAGDREWAFIDDEIHYELRQLNGRGEVPGLDPGRQLLVEADRSRGLDDLCLEQLLRFADESS